ncbi:PepSY domain-containing protein [Thiohalobacter sp. IOR34]|uniref:PepSY domain-containing protein n=1 Tax=Thiohalobacter sp. IOR34 TaxID=3057176 RepID=UPI0025B26508|nr:PepSY domain-containing protein [Thiohalobacter sp. IOR34]WJW75142.1 PepSY domain-containing protein [Thiohalobacter sp. IOR34]
MTRHKRRRLPLRSLYVWHRYLGVAVALLVTLLAISGLLLNHTEALQLDSRPVRSAWLLDWYGIEAPELQQHFSAAGHDFSQLDRQLYLDRQPIEGEYHRLFGVVSLDDLYVVGVGDGLLLLSPEGERIELLERSAGLPAGLRALGVDGEGRLLLRAAGGLFRPDADFLSWHPLAGEDEAAHWSKASPPPPRLARQLRQAYRAGILPLERVVLDLHSGRILGPWGVWLMDAAALGLLLLAASGSLLWWQQQRKRRAHRRERSKRGAHRGPTRQ